MANDTLLREFTSQLAAFGAEDVSRRGLQVFREVAQTVAEAVVIGSQYGPGVPLDTGFLRASFRVSESVPEDGPSTPPPPVAGRTPGSGVVFGAALDMSAAARAKFGVSIYVTTIAQYAVYLEEGSMRRRHGPPENVGAPTPFIAPVEARFGQLANDVAQRVGYGR